MSERKIFPLKLNDEEKAMLAALAKDQSMDMSGYLRWLIRQMDREKFGFKLVRAPGRPAFKKGDRRR